MYTPEYIAELEEENARLKAGLLSTPIPRDVNRFGLKTDPMDGDQYIGVRPQGEYVRLEDYEWMSAYADRLVEFGNLPCLPADLANLRESNAQLATENIELKRMIFDIKNDLALLLL